MGKRIKKIRIAVIGSRGYPFVYSGYETFIKETFELLNDKYDVHVYCHRHLFGTKPKEVNGIKLHYTLGLNHKSFSQLSYSLFATLHAIFFGKYDVILYVNTANGPFGFLTRLFKIKSAIITDGLEWLRPKWSGKGAKYFYWASEYSTKVFDVLISDSQEMRRIYLDKFSADSVVIEYGANPKKSIDGSKIRQYGLDKNEYYLVVARLVPDNNADVIVEGFKNANTDKKLVVVGDVPYQDDYADRIKANASDKIVFTGYVTDQELLMELYSNAYVYIHGHEYGGTNPTLLKALAYGCSILALDTGFSREVLQNEKYGTYFKKNAAALATCVESLDGQAERVQEQKSTSRTRITEHYTWQRIADEYDKLFKDMCEKGFKVNAKHHISTEDK